jgi:hypothetical protein
LLLCGCLTSVGPVAFRSFVLRVSFAPPWHEQPNRSLRVRPNKLRAHVVANTHAASDRFRISPLGAGSSAAHALRRFTCVQHVHAPMASTAHPLTGLAAFDIPLLKLWYPTAMHLPLQCWVPSAEAPGLDFHLLFVSHAEHTPPGRLMAATSSLMPLRRPHQAPGLRIGYGCDGEAITKLVTVEARWHAAVGAPPGRESWPMVYSAQRHKGGVGCPGSHGGQPRS